SPHRHDCRVSQVISRRSEAPSAVRVFGDFPAVDLSDGGCSPRHGAVVRGRDVPPKSPSAENRPQCGGRQAETAAPSGAVALHTVRCAGSAHPARLKKNDGTTMACGGH
ncbi:hypothetical protein OSK38_25720, partial [Escherichia coli]|nr:hypothetical protein [Escherichia coli]